MWNILTRLFKPRTLKPGNYQATITHIVKRRDSRFGSIYYTINFKTKQIRNCPELPLKRYIYSL